MPLLYEELLYPPILRIPIDTDPIVQLPQLIDHGYVDTLFSAISAFRTRIHHRHASCWRLQLENVFQQAIETANGDVVH